jgi:two-component system chemotaxis response regulator CheY
MKQILIVDDAATVRMYHRHILEAAGYRVDEAVNGVEALEKAVSARYDLYLVDINMPLLDGYSFLKELRRQDMPQSPVIMVSTEAAAHDRDRAYAAGANLYIVKPTRPDALLAHVRVMTGEAFA